MAIKLSRVEVRLRGSRLPSHIIALLQDYLANVKFRETFKILFGNSRTIGLRTLELRNLVERRPTTVKHDMTELC